MTHLLRAALELQETPVSPAARIEAPADIAPERVAKEQRHLDGLFGEYGSNRRGGSRHATDDGTEKSALAGRLWKLSSE